MNYKTWKSPVGRIHIVANDLGILCLGFDENFAFLEDPPLAGTVVETSHPHIKQAIRELDEYFKGKRKTFDVPVHLEGTEFQRKAWRALGRIGYGKTATYRDQARRVGQPKAVRAVGRANGLNPVCILVPCHRVIGSDGSLTGYSGGIRVKKALLELESKHAAG